MSLPIPQIFSDHYLSSECFAFDIAVNTSVPNGKGFCPYYLPLINYLNQEAPRCSDMKYYYAGRQRLDGPYMARVAPHARRLAGPAAVVCVVRHPWHAQRRRRGCVGGLDVCTAYKGPLEINSDCIRCARILA